MLLRPGRYAKWNLGCDNVMCHAAKLFSERRKRRAALAQDIAQNIADWAE